MFEDIVFDKTAQGKLRIFKKLTELIPGTYTYNQLAQETHFTYQQFYKLIHELNDELLTSGQLESSLIVPNTGIITEKLTLSIDEYRFFLINLSLPFQLLQALLLEPDLGIEAFCRRHFVSRATVSRRTRRLVDYLQKYQLAINFQQFRLSGQETAIRLVFFYFFFIGYRNLHWPFALTKAQAQTYAQPFLQLSPLERNDIGKFEVLLYAAIAMTRIQQGKWTTLDPQLAFLFVNKDLDFTEFAAELGLTKEAAEGEITSIYFLANFLPFYENENDPAIQRTIQNFTKSENIIWRFVEEFRRFVLEDLKLTMAEKERNLMMANLANVATAFYGFGGPFPNLPYLMKRPSLKTNDTQELEARIRAFLENLTAQEEFAVFRSSLQSLVQVLRFGIASFYNKLTKEQPLRVGLIMESNLILVKPLLDFLQGINFIVVDYFQEAASYDFLITTFSKVEGTLPAFYWDYNEGYQNLAPLYTALREAYVKKNR